MSRGRQLTRTLRLVQLLARPQGASVGEVARELDCTPRTVYRDLHSLEEVGYPVYVDREDGGATWRLVDGFRWRHQIPMTHEEVAALWLGREALEALDGTSFGEAARSALGKLGVVLSAAVRERLERARETLAVAAPARRYAGRAPVADALRRAAEERRTVEVVYEPLDGGRGRRLLDPYLIWFDPVGSALYVAGWAHDRREVRTFLVDRIRQVLATGRTFERAAGWDARAYLGEAFATFRGRAQDVRLHFSGRAARLVAERTWHPSQTARPRPGGQLELAMRVPLSPAFTGWVLSWMPEVRALAPLSLVRSVHDALVRGLVLEGRVAASREN